MEDVVVHITMAAITHDELVRTFSGRRVFVTGHTGFKGGWLTYWLATLGAEVTGYALAAETPSLFESLALGEMCQSHEADVRDLDSLERALRASRPDFIIHMAAQSLVRRSYSMPIETIHTNVLGTANVLEAVRHRGEPCVVIVVTSDKCYENREWVHGYRESDPLGGHDIYAVSKGAAELVVSGYRRSFFPVEKVAAHGVRVASVRAGNVVGGGDWAEDRVVPDCMRALQKNRAMAVRNPSAVRPWQHVLEPLSGYLTLAARMDTTDSARAGRFCEAWNFGPDLAGARSVRDLIEEMTSVWGWGSWVDASDRNAPHEALQLRLSIEKATAELGWAPRWDFRETCRRTVAWYKLNASRPSVAVLRDFTLSQIQDYLAESEYAEPGRQAAGKAAD